jgi:homoserine O-acetyltransferase
MGVQEHLFHYEETFQLEAGKELNGFQLKYTTAGQLNKARDNAVWICHALTGSSDFSDWWKSLFENNSPFPAENYFIISANTLGGCYGSTGPLSQNPKTRSPYYHNFPLITNRDVVRAFDLLREHLELERIHTLIGGSLGGQQVLEWGIFRPAVFQRIVPIACNAFHSSWGIAFNESQRMAIEGDSTWNENDPRAGINGMKAARAIAMLSFRSYESYEQTQSEKSDESLDEFRASSYQLYQGQKLANRFNAFTYWTLTKAMDNHNVGRGRQSISKALGQIKAKALIIGVDSDILFPVHEQELLARHISNATLKVITSPYGHDGFLIEVDQVKKIINHFLKEEYNQVLS